MSVLKKVPTLDLDFIIFYFIQTLGFFFISESQFHIAKPHVNQKRRWLWWGSGPATAKQGLWENGKQVPLAFSYPLL